MTTSDPVALARPNAEADQLRQQLLQAQKMSSVGTLASSVAHEFNNVLTTIIIGFGKGVRSSGDIDLQRRWRVCHSFIGEVAFGEPPKPSA